MSSVLETKRVVQRNIINACKKGDQRAFKVFYQNTAAYAYSIVSRYIYDESNRMDVIQEAYADLFTKIEKYNENKGQIKSWLRKVIVNRCLMTIRKEKSRLQFSEMEIVSDVEDDIQLTWDRLTKSDILHILEDMPEGYRIIFMMVEIDGYDHGEVSELLDIRPQSSRSQLSRAKKWLYQNNIVLDKLMNYGVG